MKDKEYRSAYFRIKQIASLVICLIIITAGLPISAFAVKKNSQKVIRVGWHEAPILSQMKTEELLVILMSISGSLRRIQAGNMST